MDFINSTFVIAVMLTSLMLGDILVAAMFALLDIYQSAQFARDSVADTPGAPQQLPTAKAPATPASRPVEDYLQRERSPRRAMPEPAVLTVARALAPWNRDSRAIAA